MYSIELHAYAQEGSKHDSSLRVEFDYDSSSHLIRLNFHIPPSLEVQERDHLNQRRHELWKGTCFECFIAYQDQSYDEWNFNLNGDWQSYHFKQYRTPAPPTEAQVDQTRIEFLLKNKQLFLELPTQKWVESINPCVIIKGNHFFAHKHAEQKADFHNLKTFIDLKEA